MRRHFSAAPIEHVIVKIPVARPEFQLLQEAQILHQIQRIEHVVVLLQSKQIQYSHYLNQIIGKKYGKHQENGEKNRSPGFIQI